MGDVRGRAEAALATLPDARVHSAEGWLARAKHQSSLSAGMLELERWRSDSVPPLLRGLDRRAWPGLSRMH